MDFQVRSAFPRVFVVPAAVYDERVLGISDLRGGGEGGGVAVEERGRVESVRSYSRAESVLAVSGLGDTTYPHAHMQTYAQTRTRTHTPTPYTTVTVILVCVGTPIAVPADNSSA